MTQFYVIFTMNIIIVLTQSFQNIMRVGDQKLMINLEWPYHLNKSSELRV